MLINHRLLIINLILSFLIRNPLLGSFRYHLLIINLINLSFIVHSLLLQSFKYRLKHHHSLNCHQLKRHPINFINHINLLRFKYPSHLELKHLSPRQ